jgi:integrase
MSITKRTRTVKGKKSACYKAEIYVRGVRLASRTFGTIASAHAWHSQEKEKLENGDTHTRREDHPFLKDCIKEYFEWGELRLRRSSLQTYQTRVTYLIDGPLGSTRMVDINSQAIDHWQTWLKKHPTTKNKGRKSFEKELLFLTVILNWYRNYKDASFVVQITKRHRENCVFRKIAPRRPDYFARPDEIRAWIDWLYTRQRTVYAELATFMILTGCRVGEAAALHWTAVDLNLKLARIVRTVYWDHVTRRPELQESTKTEDSVRIVLLPDFLVEQLREMKLRSGGNPLVFTGRDGSYLKYNAIQSRFNAGFEALNLPWRSTHICRHTYATMALFATKDISGVQASLGHKKREMTEKYAKSVAMLSSGTAEQTSKQFNLNIRSIEQK